MLVGHGLTSTAKHWINTGLAAQGLLVAVVLKRTYTGCLQRQNHLVSRGLTTAYRCMAEPWQNHLQMLHWKGSQAHGCSRDACDDDLPLDFDAVGECKPWPFLRGGVSSIFTAGSLRSSRRATLTPAEPSKRMTGLELWLLCGHAKLSFGHQSEPWMERPAWSHWKIPGASLNPSSLE